MATDKAITEVAPGVYRIDTWHFNWYVIEEAGRLTLVDAGFPAHYADYRRLLDHLGRSETDLEAVVLTHAHADHTGFARAAADAADCPVFVHALDEDKAASRLQLPWATLLPTFVTPFGLSMGLYAAAKGVLEAPRIPKARPVHDDDTLDIPGRPLVVHTPGHTPGHASLYLPGRDTLIAGDALLTRNVRNGRSHAPNTAPRGFNMDEAQAVASARSLKRFGRCTVLTGHGPPWTGDLGASSQA